MKPAKKIEVNHSIWTLPKWAKEDSKYKDKPAEYYKEYIDYVKSFNAGVDAAKKEQKNDESKEA